MKKVYDDKQQEVIKFNDGHALVLGAPGCGKTDILSLRVLMSHLLPLHLETSLNELVNGC